MMKYLKPFLIFSLFVLFFVSARQDKTTTIFMIGDSTMANKDITDGKLERGWGMALQCYFDDDVRIANHAVNGRSSLSFFNEGRWQKVLDKIQPGDYVVIQFGHSRMKGRAERQCGGRPLRLQPGDVPVVVLKLADVQVCVYGAV